MPNTSADTISTTTADVEAFRRAFDALNETVKRFTAAMKQALDEISKATAKLRTLAQGTDGLKKEQKEELDKTIEKIISTFRKNLEVRVDKIIDAFGDAFEGALLGDRTKFKNLGETVKGELRQLGLDTLKVFREQLREAIFAPVKEELKSALDEIFGTAGEASKTGGAAKSGTASQTGGSQPTAGGAAAPLGGFMEQLGALFASIRDGMGEVLGSLLRGFGALGRGLGDMLSGLLNGVSRVLGGIFSGGGAFSGGGGLGGLLSGLLGGVSSALGGVFGRSATPLADAAAAAGIFSPFEHGGRFAANQPILVGEAGPELLVPPMAGEIVPNRALGALARQQPINQKFVINVSPGVPEAVRATILSLKPQIQQWAVEGIVAASMRGGAIARMPRI